MHKSLARLRPAAFCGKALAVALLFFVLGMLGAVPARAQLGDALGLSPFLSWKAIETEHFRVTYPAELAETARQAANDLEEAHRLLSPALFWEPSYKVPILVIDNQDAANGLTSATARFGIVLITTPPDNWFSTYAYDDWLRLVAIHEYTHFLNMDATRGIWKGLRYVFGDLLLPNSVWPSWMLEGLAVYDETRYTHAGRGRSAYYEMLIRAAVEAGALDRPDWATLDEVNGPDPRFPFGESVYHFGYELMNEAARAPLGPETADHRPWLLPPPVAGDGGQPGEQVLGEMSRRSSKRFPFFINGNLKNIRGEDWYSLWDSWVDSARRRAGGDLTRIRGRPVTKPEALTHEGGVIVGPAVSPDGKWLAFHRETKDRVNSLFLRDVATGAERDLGERVLGGTLAFSPDSKRLYSSTLSRYHDYDLYSDLWVHDLERGSDRQLTHGLRARSPDVSRDGKWIAFTLARGTAIGVAIAEFTPEGIGEPKILYMPARFDACYTPRFSPDGKRLYFTYHPNGKAQENLMELDVAGGAPRALVADGHTNRFPTVAPTGETWFVSDRTGVDNLYRLRAGGRPELMTNVTSGLWFPSFAGDGKLYAASFSYRGWDVARVSPAAVAEPDAVKVSDSPAPKPDAKSDSHAPDKLNGERYTEKGYSVWPSILPRQWSPLLVLSSDPDWVYAGAEVLGNDQLDLHEYALFGAYDSRTKRGDWFATYANRMLGPQLAFSAQQDTPIVDLSSAGATVGFERRLRYNAQASFPIQFTFSTLEPVIAFHTERTFDHRVGANPTDDDIVSRGDYVPYADARLIYNEIHRSHLAVSPEEGRSLEVGSRTYFALGSPIVKGLARGTQYLDWPAALIPHSVLVPSAAYSWVTRTSPYRLANVDLLGRATGQIAGSIPATDLDQLGLRGYPNAAFFARSAGDFALDYRFPTWQVHRGWGTNPAFFEYFSGFVFAETGLLPDFESATQWLPAYGAGVNARLDLLNNIPLQLSLQLHHGTRKDLGGDTEVFFQLGLDTGT